jgi:hypothetical protein
MPDPLLDLAETLDTLADGLERDLNHGLNTNTVWIRERGRIEGYRNAAQLARKRATTDGPLLNRSTA